MNLALDLFLVFLVFLVFLLSSVNPPFPGYGVNFVFKYSTGAMSRILLNTFKNLLLLFETVKRKGESPFERSVLVRPRPAWATLYKHENLTNGAITMVLCRRRGMMLWGCGVPLNSNLFICAVTSLAHFIHPSDAKSKGFSSQKYLKNSVLLERTSHQTQL